MDDDARVPAQSRVKLAVPDVDRVHAPGSTLQEHVGEAAGRGAQVAADQIFRIELEVIEAVLQLESAARDVAERLAALEPQLDRLVEQLSRFLDPVVPRHHFAGEDQRLRLAARFRQPPQLHEHVGAAPRHHRSRAAPGPGGPISAWMRASSRSMSIGLEK